MRLKRILLFLVFSFLLCETIFLYGGYENLRNIGNKFKVLIENPFERLVEINLTEKRLKTVTELRLRREGITIQMVSSLNKLLDVFFIDYYEANPKENKKGEIFYNFEEANIER